MKDLILCGNGGLLQYIRGEVSRDGTKNIRLIIDRISDIRSCNEFESADILLGVSWEKSGTDVFAVYWCHIFCGTFCIISDT